MDNLFYCSTLIQQNSTLIEQQIYRLNGAMFYFCGPFSGVTGAFLDAAQILVNKTPQLLNLTTS
ncbi:MAG: hypothetical protein NWE92_07940 [Candidatus Bathyarchaeota archaeon]|nr:hypothetical protein [Candidatus Bathyarchaeota archaeon]